MKWWINELGSLQSRRVWESVGKIRACKVVFLTNEVECYAVDSPEQTKLDSLISPPVVFWCADCTIERHGQLFLLRRLPISKKIIAQTSRPIINSFGTNSKDRTNDLIESVLIRPTLSKPSHSAAVEMRKLYSLNLCHSVLFWKKFIFHAWKCHLQNLVYCLNFEPIFESHKGKYRVHIRPLHFLLEFIAIVQHFSHPLEVMLFWGSHFEVYGALGDSTGLYTRNWKAKCRT